MGSYIADTVVKMMTKRRIQVVSAKILILGLAFKENCPDLRNTRVIDIITTLESYHADVEVYDPWVDPIEAQKEYQIDLQTELKDSTYDAVILAVSHNAFSELGVDAIRKLGKQDHILYDIKSLFPKEQVDGRL